MSKKRKLGAILFEGFELLDLYGPLEMFGCLGPDLAISTVAESAGPVASSVGPETVAEHAFENAPDFDLYLVPGGLGVFAQQDNAVMLDYLRRVAPTAERFMTVCNGAALPASAGLLDGRRATTNKIFFDTVEGRSDQVEWVKEARWVEDGPFVTASGVSAGTDMALAVIASLYGQERAEAVAILTEYGWQREGRTDAFHAHLNEKKWVGIASGVTTDSQGTGRGTH